MKFAGWRRIPPKSRPSLPPRAADDGSASPVATASPSAAQPAALAVAVENAVESSADTCAAESSSLDSRAAEWPGSASLHLDTLQVLCVRLESLERARGGVAAASLPEDGASHAAPALISPADVLRRLHRAYDRLSAVEAALAARPALAEPAPGEARRAAHGVEARQEADPPAPEAEERGAAHALRRPPGGSASPWTSVKGAAAPGQPGRSPRSVADG